MKNTLRHKLNSASAYFNAQIDSSALKVIELVFRSSKERYILGHDEVNFAISNGVAAHLKSKQLSFTTDEIKNKLQKSYFTTLLKNTQLFNTIQWICQLLDQNEINYLFIKGSLLAFTRYEDSSQRPMSDIDILIEPNKAKAAYHILITNGAKGQTQEPIVSKNDHHLPSLMHNNTMIEVHQSLFPEDAKYNIPVPDLFASSVIWKKDKISLPGPDKVLSVFYIATHLYYTYLRGGLRLSWFYDLKTCIEDISESDPNHLYAIAANHKLMKPLSFAGTVYYCLAQEALPNWPLNDEYIPDKREISRIVNSFKAGTQQKTSESYQLIIEQIREAKGLNDKWRIITNRLNKNGQLKGTELIHHFLVVSGRSIGYLGHSILKTLGLK